jgi:hypothetical protein
VRYLRFAVRGGKTKHFGFGFVYNTYSPERSIDARIAAFCTPEPRSIGR